MIITHIVTLIHLKLIQLTRRGHNKRGSLVKANAQHAMGLLLGMQLPRQLKQEKYLRTHEQERLGNGKSQYMHDTPDS